jgi:hypothetical protein
MRNVIRTLEDYIRMIHKNSGKPNFLGNKKSSWQRGYACGKSFAYRHTLNMVRQADERDMEAQAARNEAETEEMFDSGHFNG